MHTRTDSSTLDLYASNQTLICSSQFVCSPSANLHTLWLLHPKMPIYDAGEVCWKNHELPNLPLKHKRSDNSPSFQLEVEFLQCWLQQHTWDAAWVRHPC